MKKIKVGYILEDLNCHGFDYVLAHYDLTRGEILGIIEDYIAREHIDKRVKKFEYLLKKKEILTHLKGNRIGLISDTHIGNKKANFEYIRTAYDFFYYNDVDAVLHLGDLFDGYQSCDCFQSDLAKATRSFKKQLEEFKESYPTSIPTYVLLGNHDAWFREADIDLFQEIPRLNPNMTVLDYGGYRIQIHGKMFYLSHPIQNCYCVTNRGCILTLRGHAHYFEYNQQRKMFRLNTCSDTHPNPAGGDYELAGGFSMLTFPKGMINFENYSFYHGDVVKSLCLKI